MVYLNGKFILKSEAFISVMDRGFLFGDGVYEVFPVYNGLILGLESHLKRLQKAIEDEDEWSNYYKEAFDKYILRLKDEFMPPKLSNSNVRTFNDDGNHSFLYLVLKGEYEDEKNSPASGRPAGRKPARRYTSSWLSDRPAGFSALSYTSLGPVWDRIQSKIIHICKVL